MNVITWVYMDPIDPKISFFVLYKLYLIKAD